MPNHSKYLFESGHIADRKQGGKLGKSHVVRGPLYGKSSSYVQVLTRREGCIGEDLYGTISVVESKRAMDTSSGS